MKNKTSNQNTNKSPSKKKTEEENPNFTIIIDSKDNHLEDPNIFAIHPSKLNFLGNVEKESFDNAIIQNCPSSAIKTLGLFYLVKILKPSAKLEVIIDQPITVMQNLDASEIEANSKLAGFIDIEQSPFEKVVEEGEKSYTIKTICLSMVRPEKLKKNVIEVESVVVKEKQSTKLDSPRNTNKKR